MGCVVQIEFEIFVKMGEVDCVIGNIEKMQLDIWKNMFVDFVGEMEKVQVDDIMFVMEIVGYLIDGFGICSCVYVQV